MWSIAFRHCISPAVGLLVLATAAWSQTTASIVGTVSDTSGGVVAHSSVKVTNTLTGLTRSLVTGSDGSYVATLLPPGTYSVEASASGFKTVVRSGIPLSVQEAARVDVILPLGTV